MNIGLVGFNGKLNVGDDAMTMAFLEVIGKLSPDARIALFADSRFLPPNPDNLAVRGLPFLETARKIPLLRSFLSDHIYTRIFNNREGMDILIFGGGSIFKDYKPIRKHWVILNHAKMINPKVRIAALGVSIGPFKDPKAEELVLKILSETDEVVVRDKRSYQFMRRMLPEVNCRQAGDLAFTFCATLPIQESSLINSEKVTIGVALRNGMKDVEQAELVRWLLSLSRFDANIRLKFVSFCSNAKTNDNFFALDLVRKVSGGTDHSPSIEFIPYKGDPTIVYRSLAECEIVVAVRLHAAIFAIALGKKVIIYPYHQKVLDFAAEANLPDSCIIYDISNINKLDWSTSKTISMASAAKLSQRDKLISSSTNNFLWLHDVLTK